MWRKESLNVPRKIVGNKCVHPFFCPLCLYICSLGSVPAHNLVSFCPVGVQIGFEQTSYTVHEGDKSVTVCAVKTAGDIVTLVPVTLFTVDGLSAQGMHTRISTLVPHT